MNKILSILLAFILAFSLAACEQKQDSAKTDDSSPNDPIIEDSVDAVTGDDTGVSNEDWTAAIQSQKFENVTFSYDATFVSGYSKPGPFSGTYKLTNDGMMFNHELITSEESINAARTLFIDTVIAIVSNFSAFEYDQENDCYLANESIVYESEFFGGMVTITSDNTSVVLDYERNIEKLSCKMTQEFKQVDGTPVTYVLDLEIMFRDYGSTVIEYDEEATD